MNLYFQIHELETDFVNTTPNRKNQVQSTTRRKKVTKNWQEYATYASEIDALDAIRNERIWGKYTTNRTDKCSKVIYRCRNVKSRGQQCDAGIYLLYSYSEPAVTMFRSVNRHTCVFTESKQKQRCTTVSTVDVNIQSNNDQMKIDENQSASKRRKKTCKNWRMERTFQLEDDALAAIRDEETWAKYTTNKTEKGNKVIYRCRNVRARGPQCEAGVYLLYSRIDSTISLFRSVNKHNCSKIESKRKPYASSKRKIKTETKKSIEIDERVNNLKRRRKVAKNWQKEKTFELETEVLEVVKAELVWTKYTTNKTGKGKKVIYRCKNVKLKGEQCDAGIYLSYSNDNTVTLYRSGNKHTCDNIKSKSKSRLSDGAKLLIRNEYEKGMKPRDILCTVIANGFECAQIQLNNYLAHIRRDQSTVLDSKKIM